MKKRKEYVEKNEPEIGFQWKRRGKMIGMPLEDYLVKLIREEWSLGHKLRVAIGTDSQRDGRSRRYKFATVIVIFMSQDLGGGVIKSLGAKMIDATYHMNVPKGGKEGVNERMMIEVSKSIEVAYQLANLLDSFGIKMEIHADINPDPRWESNKAMAAAVGYILGMGYDFKIKPEAFAASFSSDKFCQ